MVVDRLQNGLINSSIAPWASRVNCQKIFFKWDYIFFFFVILIEIFILKTTSYPKYTLKYQKFTKKKIKKTLLSSNIRSRCIDRQWCKSHTLGINFHMSCHSNRSVICTTDVQYKVNRFYVPFCAKHWRHICAIPHVTICDLFFQLP
jgi:hypothetical protein